MSKRTSPNETQYDTKSKFDWDFQCKKEQVRLGFPVSKRASPIGNHNVKNSKGGMGVPMLKRTSPTETQNFEKSKSDWDS